MGSYPWGPHGPQSGPNQVTPNPTPAYVPPPPQPAYYPPTSSGPSYSGSYAPSAGSSVGVGYTGPVIPRPKRYWLALVLTFFFGPLGLFYASKKGALIVLLLLLGVPVSLSVAGILPYGSAAHPFAILDHDGIMNQMWSLSVILSMIWSVAGVRRHNARLKSKT